MAKAIGYMWPTIDQNVRLYVPFNEGVGSVAKDYSQYCNHAQLTDVEWSPDGFNGAGKFNASTSFGNCGAHASLDIPDAMAIGAWVNVSDTTNNFQPIISKRKGNADHVFTLWGIYSNKHSSFWMYDTDYRVAVGTTESQNDTPYYIAGTREGSLLKIYVNGQFEHQVGIGVVLGSTDEVTIGRRRYFGWDYLGGTMNNVIISTARSVAQTAADCYEVVCS